MIISAIRMNNNTHRMIILLSKPELRIIRDFTRIIILTTTADAKTLWIARPNPLQETMKM